MWVPIAAYEFSIGNVNNAIIVAIYTIIVISLVADTFLKPVIIELISTHLVKTTTKINSLIIFFAILAGISTYGFWGIILGPAVTALFISLLKIYDMLKKSRLESVESLS
jgi:predicted PurR-regulated permease PerM